MDLKDLLPVGITLVVVGIALAIGLQILGNVQDDMTASSAEANATQDAIDGLSQVTSYLPTIGLVVAAVIVIGILIAAFAFRR